MYIESVVLSNQLNLLYPLLLLTSVFPSIWEKLWVPLCIKWPDSALASVLPNEHSELISFRIDWFDLLAVQGTLKSPPAPQFKSINSSALSFLYGPTLTSIHNYWLPILCISQHLVKSIGLPGGSVVNNLPAMQGTRVQFLSQEDPLDEEMVTHSSILDWSLLGCNPWGCKGSDMTVQLSTPTHGLTAL